MKEYFESSQPYFFKLAHGVSGFWFFDNKKDTLDSTINTCKGQKIIIEEKIDLLDSPSVQFYCGEDEIIIIWVTDQILEDWRYYNWNMYPSQWVNWELENQIIKISESVLKYIHELWFKWFGGIDLMISSDKKIYVAEVNARFTWVTPALVINILLKKNLTNLRKFLLLDNHSYEEFSSQDKEERFPICIWWIKEWGKAQYLEWL
jgi:predicted ATP-grasp superfamily ATP-dependent carboligase